jgi:hypothetical protein
MTPDEFDQYIQGLGSYEYLFYDVENRSLYQVPAVPKVIVNDILNPPDPEDVEIERPETSLV